LGGTVRNGWIKKLYEKTIIIEFDDVKIESLSSSFCPGDAVRSISACL